MALEEGEKCFCERAHDKDEENGEESGDSDDDDDEEDDDDEKLGDSWIRGIDTCTQTQVPTHVHVRIPTDEKSSKRRFF